MPQRGVGKTGTIFVITGPSGVGKGTLCTLLKTALPDLKLSISATSRPRREQETDGIEYFFVSPKKFQQMIEKNELLEWAQYNNNYYGTPKAFVESLLKAGDKVLLEIETQGALMVKQQFPDACLIFIAPPTFEELRSRLLARGSNNAKEIEERLKIAEHELTLKDSFDHVLVNDTLEACFEGLKHLVLSV